MTNRTDCHSPSHINPADYSFVRVVWFTPSADMIAMAAFAGPGAFDQLRQEREEAMALIEAEGWKDGNFASKRTCDHCGAHFNYGTLYRHNVSNEIIVVGWICAGKTMDVSDRATLEYNRLVDRVHNMRKHIKEGHAIQKRKDELFQVHPEMKEAFETDHYIVRDIKGRFESTGFLSEKQMALVIKLHNESKAPKESEPTWIPITEGKRTIEGTVLATKVQEGHFGSQLKMLVKVDHENNQAEKIWVTVPSALIRGDGSLKGSKIRFTCTVSRSDRDETFGLGKRPTKGEILENTNEEATA